jgi:hypothetical protein
VSRTNIFSSFRDVGYMQRQVDYFERARQVVEEMRREAETPADLMAVAEVFDTIERWRRQAIAQLGRLIAAQHSQRAAATSPGGPVGAGRSPALEGHGCPAVAPGAVPPVSAVGPAPSGLAVVQVTTPANPLFSGPSGQTLPTVTAVGDTEAA